MAIIFVHGYAETGYIFQNIILEIKSKSNDIHNIELPGFGVTPSPKDYSIPHYSDFIYNYLKNNNISTAHFVGHSLGGYILSDFAVRYPYLVESLTYLHSHANSDSPDRKKRRLEISKSLQKFGSEPFLKLFYQGLFKPETALNFVQPMEELYKNGMKIPLKTLIELQNSMRERPDLVDSLRQISKPIFYIAGIHDPLISIEEIQFQSKQLPTSKVIVSDSAHMAQFEDSETLIAHLNSLT